MQKQHKEAGLVAMSVDLDDPKDDKVMKRVNAFLTDQQPGFATFVLDEKQETWQEKLGIEGSPAVFVFGRDGKVAKKFIYGEAYKEIEAFAVELLRKQ